MCHVVVSEHVQISMELLSITAYSALDCLLEASKMPSLSTSKLRSHALPEAFPDDLKDHVSFLEEGSCFMTFCQVNTPIDHDQTPMASAAPKDVLQKMQDYGECGLFSVLRPAMPTIF